MGAFALAPWVWTFRVPVVPRNQPCTWGWSALLNCVCTMLLALLYANAQAAPPTEYEVKAAFIHSIAKYVEWPHRAAGAMKLCVLGENPFGNALAALQGKQILGESWDVVLIGSTGDLKECRVLFIAASEAPRLRKVLESIDDSAVLTVGDTDGYAARGVMVNFILEDGKVRFEINNDAAKRVGLNLGSQLLKLARLVQQSAIRNPSTYSVAYDR